MFGAEDLTVVLDGVTALDGVSIGVPPGVVTTVVGGDGAGKSTLLRSLAGLVRPTSGTVTAPSGRGRALLPATAGSWANLTVTQNLDFAARVAKVKAPARITELIERADLTAARDRLASQLSGGMRRKLGVIMALLAQPELLLLDEPTTGVDPVSRVELWSLISHAAAEGAAVLTATTYLDEAERAATVTVLHEGRVLLAGAPAELIDAAPGRFWIDATPSEARTWRRGRRFHHWAETAPPGAATIRPDLHDVVIAASPRSTPSTAESGQARPATGAPPLVEARSAGKRFGDVDAVSGVDLAVRPGEIVGLLGANGAGKTTLMRCLLGIVSPTSGTTELFGEPPSRRNRARLGYVPQGMGLYRDLTVDQNAAFSAAAYGSTPPDLDDDRLIEQVPLGEQRRVAFDIATAHRPELLILDEPTSGVSATEAASLWDSVGAQADRGVGVLVTTHNMGEAAQCDRLVLMVDGLVAAQGSMADILGGAQVVMVETGDWQAAFDRLSAAGLPVSLAGTTARVLIDDEPAVRAALGDLQARVGSAAATLDERMAMLR